MTPFTVLDALLHGEHDIPGMGEVETLEVHPHLRKHLTILASILQGRTTTALLPDTLASLNQHSPNQPQPTDTPMNITSLKPGHHPDHKLIAFSDCLVTYSGTFIFPHSTSEEPNSKVFHHGNQIFTVEDNGLPAPTLFLYATGIFTTQEEAHDTFLTHHLHLSRSFSKLDVTLFIGHILHTLVADITFDALGIKPGLHIQGHKGTGKSLGVSATMNLIGFHSHRPISLGSTKAGIERALANYSHLPLHIDEWRNSNVDPAMTDIFIAAYNNLAKRKGTPRGAEPTLTPTANLIISGEDPITDPALNSRFIHITAGYNHASDLKRREQTAILEDFETNNQKLLLVTRFLLQNYLDFRSTFFANLHKTLQELQLRASLTDLRTIHNHAAIVAAYASAHTIITNGEDILPKLLNDIMTKLSPAHPGDIKDYVRATAEEGHTTMNHASTILTAQLDILESNLAVATKAGNEPEIDRLKTQLAETQASLAVLEQAATDKSDVYQIGIDTGSSDAPDYSALTFHLPHSHGHQLPIALDHIIAARLKQITAHGYTAEHDDAHNKHELLTAARAFLFAAQGYNLAAEIHWPFKDTPAPNNNGDRHEITNLTKAAAMIIAEIERRLRITQQEPTEEKPDRFREIVEKARDSSNSSLPTSHSALGTPPLAAKESPPTTRQLESLLGRHIPHRHLITRFLDLFGLTTDEFAAIHTACIETASKHHANPDDTLTAYIQNAAQSKIYELQEAAQSAASEAHQTLNPES